MATVDLIDHTDIADLKRKLSRVAAAVGPSVARVKPEFGAYMTYSRYLEEGTSKMMARPHILPAVLGHARVILDGFVTGALDVIVRMHKSKHGYPRKQIEKSMADVWVRVLNDKPRRFAAWAAPYQYGSHRRSIHGYAYPRTTAQIATIQTTAKEERKIRAGRKRDKWGRFTKSS